MPVADHIDNLPRTANFAPVALAGPFQLPFPLYAADDAAELKSDFLVTLAGVVKTNFTVTGTFINGVALDGAITFDVPITGALKVFSRRRPRSTVNLAAGQAVTTEELQAIINGVIATQRDVFDFLVSLEAGTVLPAGTFVPTSGGAMTGFLDLVADPTTALKAATKQYVDGKLTSTTKGDLIGHTGAASVRVPVGGNGKRLIADSAQASGLGYARNGGTLQVLADAANIAWDMDLGDDALVTLGANRTLSAPSNQVINQRGYLDVVMDATGGRTLAFNAAFKFSTAGANDEKPCPDIGATTRYSYWVRGANDIVIKKVWVSARDSIGFWKEYDKGAYAVSTGYTQAHLLGRLPAGLEVWIECTTANIGYAVGDRLLIANVTTSAGTVSASAMVNATNAQFNTGPTLPAFVTPAFAVTAITAANWKVILRVFE